MSRRASGHNGFTFAEFLMAMLMFMFLLMGLASIYGTAMRFQSKDYRQGLLEDFGVVVTKRMTLELERAVRVDLPAAGSSGSTLQGGRSPLDAGSNPTQWFVFCRDGSNTLRYYTGSGAAPSPAVTCGQAGGEIVSTHVTSLSFRRTAPAPSLMLVDLEMNRGDQKVALSHHIQMLQSSD